MILLSHIVSELFLNYIFGTWTSIFVTSSTQSSNWKLFSYLITTFIVSTLSNRLYLSVNYTTNRWPNNLQFGWFFASIIFENKSKRWTVPMIELCCQLVGMHMFAFYFTCGHAHVKGTVYIYTFFLNKNSGIDKNHKRNNTVNTINKGESLLTSHFTAKP